MGASWDDLPVELKLIVFDFLSPSERNRTMIPRHEDDRHNHHISAYAAVSKGWQAVFERRIFYGLVLQLSRYGCELCDLRETHEEEARNNKIFTASMWDLFSILARWRSKDQESTYKSRLILMLSAYSPSDREHYFRDHRFGDDCKTYYDSPRIHHHDPFHGWFFGEQVRLDVGPKQRLFGRPLNFDFHHIGASSLPSLPKLDFVAGLIIPRQFYRPIPRIDLIIRSLPKLEILRYEPWYPIAFDRAWTHELDILGILEALPQTVTKFSGYKDSNDALSRNSRGTFFPVPGSRLAQISQRFKELDISFIIDARWFFSVLEPFADNSKVDLSWDDLEGLTMTSKLLSSGTGSEELDSLLGSAAQAALRMPKLQMMELWSGKRGEAYIFRYTRFKDESHIEWWDTGLVPMTLRPKVIQAWQMVADRYVRGRLVVKIRNIPPRNIKCRGSILSYLKRSDRTLTSASLQQIQWETKELMPVRRQAPAMITAHSV
ncbi:hypothetical protein F4781DRAFT_435469 [Annulohypoxylon bovei var. microspora]|nr:hypothetical protein F4781DRAFT_435469 [Annulohypoxylon bovei var. microspora]